MPEYQGVFYIGLPATHCLWLEAALLIIFHVYGSLEHFFPPYSMISMKSRNTAPPANLGSELPKHPDLDAKLTSGLQTVRA